MSWTDCELNHGPRRAGTRCNACSALEEVGPLRADIAKLRSRVAKQRFRIVRLDEALWTLLNAMQYAETEYWHLSYGGKAPTAKEFHSKMQEFKSKAEIVFRNVEGEEE